MAIQTPYLLFLGDAVDQLAAKTAQGIAHWRPEFCVGQLRLAGCKADLGLADVSLEAAAAAGAKTLVVGVANRGGVISEAWIEVLVREPPPEGTVGFLVGYGEQQLRAPQRAVQTDEPRAVP